MMILTVCGAVAGGGMTVALSDTLLLCDMLRPLPDFSDPLATAATTHAFYTRRKPLSATINTLANALYQVLRVPRHPYSALHWPILGYSAVRARCSLTQTFQLCSLPLNFL